MAKYQEGIREEQIGTSNGFWYDLTGGGYIIPSEVITDQKKIAALDAAINLLREWEEELEADGILKEF